MTKPGGPYGPKVPGPGAPEGYRPKRGGANPSWFPEVTVAIRVTPDDAAFFKARMGEKIAEQKEEA